MEPVTVLSMGIQLYLNHIRKIARYGSVTGLAPTELVPIQNWGSYKICNHWILRSGANYLI